MYGCSGTKAKTLIGPGSKTAEPVDITLSYDKPIDGTPMSK
jgi:hypothetical protein